MYLLRKSNISINTTIFACNTKHTDKLSITYILKDFTNFTGPDVGKDNAIKYSTIYKLHVIAISSMLL